MTFEIVDRPARNRRHIQDDDLSWDGDIEQPLRETLVHGKAIVLSLERFHSSPAKGRLWKEGWRVHHRVLPDRRNVAAWIEEDPVARAGRFLRAVVLGGDPT